MSGYAWNMPTVGKLLTGIAADLQTALTADTEKVEHVVISPGLQPADDWCQCGQLTLWCATKYRTRVFPNDDGGIVTNCDDFKIAFDCRVRMMRCVHGMDDNGKPPKDSALTQDALLQEADAWVIWGTLSCVLEELANTSIMLISDWQVYAQTAVGPLGGCAGTETSFRFALIPQCCPLDPSLT